MSPAGTSVDVCSDNGGGNDDVFNGTLFDDQSANSATTYVYTNLVTAPDLRPEQSLNTSFRGQNPNGTWTLNVFDDAGGDVGTLVSWSLSITDGAITSIPPSFGAPQTRSTGPIAVAINDNATSTAPLAVSGVTTNVGQVKVYVEITHTWNADLDISVQSPAATTVLLSDNRGGANDNVFNGTLFDMASADAIGSFAFANNVVATNLRPDGNLGLFAGQDGNGTWNLIVTDSAGGDVGTIHRWDLTLAGCSNGPISHFGLVHTPLGGATLGTSGGNLSVTNIGSSGNDGVRIDLGETDGWRNESATGFDPSVLPNGAYTEVTVRGTVNGVPDQSLGSFRKSALAGKIEVEPDFSALSLNSHVIDVYAGGVLVHREVGHVGPAIRMSAAEPVGYCTCYTRVRGGSYCCVNFTGAMPIEVVGVGTFVGDEVIIGGMPGPSVTLGAISAIEVRGSQVGAIGLAGEAVYRFDAFSRALGSARFLGVPAGLNVTNIGSSGNDGVEVFTERATGFEVSSLMGVDLGGTGVARSATVRGRINSMDDQVMTLSSIVGNAGAATLSTDFGPLGSNLSQVTAFDPMGATVGTFPIGNNQALNINNGGTWPGIFWCRTGYRCEPNQDIAVYGWCGSICVGDPNTGTQYNNIARLEVAALNITAARDFVSSVAIQGNIGSLVVDDIDVTPLPTSPGVTYCTSGTTSNGCNATMSASGVASISAGTLVLTASSVEGQKQGLIFYGISGRNALAWGNGSSFLCVKSPTQRSPAIGSGGTLNGCDGSISLNFFGYLNANPGAIGNPLTAGTTFDAQCWFRDPPAPKSTSLSNGLEFTLVP